MKYTQYSYVDFTKRKPHGTFTFFFVEVKG